MKRLLPAMAAALAFAAPAGAQLLPGEKEAVIAPIAGVIAPGAEWADVKPDVLGIVMDHFLADVPLFNAASAGFSVPAEDEGFADDPADADIVEQIKELIETRVRPAVANDGGDIIYRGFDKGNVYLKLQGACAGCPSSTATLKNGIESLLKHYVPEVTAVHAV